MGDRPLQRYLGSCHCGAVRFEIEAEFPELTTPDHLGINVFCLHDFGPGGIPVRRANGVAMP